MADICEIFIEFLWAPIGWFNHGPGHEIRQADIERVRKKVTSKEALKCKLWCPICASI